MKIANCNEMTLGIFSWSTLEPEEGVFNFPKDLFHIIPSAYHTHFDDLMRMSNDFLSLETDEPKVFFIMGHGYELDVGDGWQKTEEFLKLISGRKDIFYGTVQQVLLCK